MQGVFLEMTFLFNFTKIDNFLDLIWNTYGNTSIMGKVTIFDKYESGDHLYIYY